jgi:glycosyltransferase involved in cell wall biosynthesis
MKIFGWTADHSGCGWYRIILPLATLQSHGHETWFNGKMPEEAWEADVVVAQRTCMPGPTEILHRMAKHKGKRPKIVFELDDDLWSIDSSNPTADEFYAHPEVRGNLIANIKVADVVTVSTHPLADVVRKWNPNVVVLENCIPGELLTWQHGRYIDRLTVGWQGSPTHDADWKPIATTVGRWFTAARKMNAPVEMHTIGEVPTTFPDVYPHRQTNWSDRMSTYYRVIDWDVALAPLRRSLFNTSKSHLRVLEAAALGIPVVASNVAAYRDFVIDGQTGFLCSNPSDWPKYLDEMAHEPEMRQAMEHNSRKLAAQWTIEQNAEQWEAVYAS